MANEIPPYGRFYYGRTKPSNVPEGTIFIDETTGVLYLYANGRWIKSAKLSALTIDSDLQMGSYDIIFTTGSIYYADIAFRETRCELCGQCFEQGQVLVLVVTGTADDPKTKGKGTLARPVHLKCALEGGLVE